MQSIWNLFQSPDCQLPQLTGWASVNWVRNASSPPFRFHSEPSYILDSFVEGLAKKTIQFNQLLQILGNCQNLSSCTSETFSEAEMRNLHPVWIANCWQPKVISTVISDQQLVISDNRLFKDMEVFHIEMSCALLLGKPLHVLVQFCFVIWKPVKLGLIPKQQSIAGSYPW